MERFSRAEIYLHLIWATYRRIPVLVGDAERVAYACIVREVKRAGCKLLAIGGMPDHVHVALALAPSIAPARLVQQMKGVSSAAVRTQVLLGEPWGWQDGYGAYSFSRSHMDRVISYVRNQKQHHRSDSTWPAWETTAADERQR
jgi:REP element-mobilizing transposase RayT